MMINWPLSLNYSYSAWPNPSKESRQKLLDSLGWTVEEERDSVTWTELFNSISDWFDVISSGGGPPDSTSRMYFGWWQAAGWQVLMTMDLNMTRYREDKMDFFLIHWSRAGDQDFELGVDVEGYDYLYANVRRGRLSELSLPPGVRMKTNCLARLIQGWPQSIVSSAIRVGFRLVNTPTIIELLPSERREAVGAPTMISLDNSLNRTLLGLGVPAKLFPCPERLPNLLNVYDYDLDET